MKVMMVVAWSQTLYLDSSEHDNDGEDLIPHMERLGLHGVHED